MERIQPHFLKEARLSVDFTWKNFFKKGYHTLPKLKVDLYIASSDASNKRNAKKALFRKTFKRIKFVRNLDLSQVTIPNRDEFLSTFQYIAKKMSKVSALSIEDSRSLDRNFNPLTGTGEIFFQ